MLLLLPALRPAHADGPSGGGIVEETRYAEAGGLLVEQRVLIDTSVVSDPRSLADAVTGIGAASSGVTAQYALNPWRWRSADIPVPVVYDASTAGSLPSLEPWIRSAVDQWSGISTAFRFTYAGTSRTPVGACIGEGSSDGVNTIAYGKGMDRGVLGQTCTLATNRGQVVEFDMQLSADVAWGTGSPIGLNEYDLPTTILHEMGHAAALGHPCPVGNPSACTAAEAASVMFPTVRRGEMKRTLQPDDIAGLMAQYPGASPSSTPSPARSPSPTPAPAATPPAGAPRGFQVITAALAHD